MNIRLPVGFVDSDRGRFRVIAPRLALDEMTALLTGPGRDGPVYPGGRGGTRRVVLPGGSPVFCRTYLRGGWARRLTSNLFLLRPERPLRELVATEAARAAGCAVPAVLACAIQDVGPFYRGWIVTEEVPNAVPFVDCFLAAEAAERPRWLRRLRTEIEGLHRAGIRHVDLTGDNVLVADDRRIVVIDLDRARLGGAVPDSGRAKTYARFRRSMTKLAKARGASLDGEDWRCLIADTPR